MRREYLWALLTLIIAIALAFVLLMVAKDNNNLRGATQQFPPLPNCIESETRENLRRMSDRAVDQGYQRHVSHLLDILMGNPNKEQFERARVGMQNGIKGFLLAQEHIEKWMPPVC